MKKKVSFMRVLRLAGAYVACAIGSGFATGQEIMQFFTGQGIWSMAGILVNTFLFSLCGALFMKHGFVHRLDNPTEIMKLYFGKRFGSAVEIIFQVFLYGVYVIMIAGAGATLEEYFGINPIVGRIFMALAVFATVVLGLSKLTDVLGMVGPLIILFALFVGIWSFFRDPSAIFEADRLIATVDIVVTKGGWFWSSVLYPAFNAVVVLILSCSIGRSAESEEEAFRGGLLGGILFGAAICTMNLGLLANLGEVWEKYIPTLTLAKHIGSVFATVFSVIICMGTYTTAVPMLWGIARHFAPDRSLKMTVLALALTVVGLILGATDFKVLVNVIYPFSGYAGVLLIALSVLREVLDKKKKPEIGGEQ